MHREFAAIDLETTGLTPAQDRIIEVGAVTMLDGEITGEFSTFINPGIPIPAFITHITGIQNQDVAGAPRIETILPQLTAFVGNRPIIAHNTSMDMGFLQGKHQILLNASLVDTYDLASILMPRAARYNLSSLTSDFSIDLKHAHRALDDARATAVLFWKLWHQMLELPLSTLQEIVSISRGLNWESGWVFEQAYDERRRSPAQEAAIEDTSKVFSPAAYAPALRPEERPSALDATEVDAMLGETGSLSETLPTFEYRPQQVEMAHQVTEAFNDGKHILIEAGTGTGKSLAYLVPVALWSTRNKRPVLISTYTLNLQDQLLYNDIPLVRSVVASDFKAVVLKGRDNYLCPRRLTAIRRRRPTTLADMRTVAKILVWLLETETGEKNEISLRGPVENAVWQRLSAADEGCSLNRCQAMMQGACPFFKARKAADAANLIIVNHALLVSDAASENAVLPDYQHVVIDEAHQLEDAVTSGMSFHIDQSALIRRIADLGGPNRGLLGELLLNVRDLIPEKDLNRLQIFIQSIDEATTLMGGQVEAYFRQLHTFFRSVHSSRTSDYNTFMRVIPSSREHETFAALQAQWGTLSEYFEVISEAMVRLNKALGKLRDYDIPAYDDFIASTEAAAQYLEDVRRQLNSFTTEPDANSIYWLSIGNAQAELPELHSAPLHVGPIVEQVLWLKKETVVLTSATLRTGDSFHYINERLYAENAENAEVGSPFDYASSTLLYLPNDIPEPSERQAYQRAVERGIIELAAALNGRVLVLFTSYSQLRETSQAVTPRLALGGIAVYDQSDGSSRQALVDGFKSTEKAVLLGTRSFWEGIDIPGEALSAVVITRLPFSVPTDPIFAARSEKYTDSFNAYAVPDAVLRFRQGFGRLIRSKTDRGIITVFDSRIINKSYGSVFLDSLPECTVKTGSLDNLAVAATNWLKSDRGD
jgi:ATP-dependent DNA helicase DinG